MEIVVVAVIAGVVGPGILAWLTGRQRRAEKEQDWRRQDDVADKAAELAEAQSKRAEEVAAQAREAAELLLESNKDVAAEAAKQGAKLDDLQVGQQQIHTLVNSNMTAAMQSDLDANKRDVVSMRRIIALTEAAGNEPTTEDHAAIKSTEDRITALAAELEDRLAANVRADREKHEASPDDAAAAAAADAARAAAIAARSEPR